jgi:8-oxo-dGTP pyrophosphatase MutT (NUDIX family)
MLRRSARSTFMPDTLVFPGGRVEHIDLDGDGETDDSAFEAAARRECLEECGVDITGRELTWFDTWKTPSGESPRRYLARFYFARLAAHEGREAKADGVETEDGRWNDAAGHLASWEAGEVDLPPPTVSVLLHLASAGPGGFATGPEAELRTPILPKVIATQGTVAILLPHDQDYTDAPGDSDSCPSRAAQYPRRFLRRDERWQPHR